MWRATIAFRLCSPYFVFMAHDHLTLKGSLDPVPDGHAIGAWKLPGLCGGVVSVGPLAGRPVLPPVRLGRQQPLSTGTQDAVPLARACGQAMSARAGTPMEASHLPVRIWATAMFLMACSSKGISARQLGLRLGLQYRTAWHLSHRIRRMMAADDPVLRGVVDRCRSG